MEIYYKNRAIILGIMTFKDKETSFLQEIDEKLVKEKNDLKWFFKFIYYRFIFYLKTLLRSMKQIPKGKRKFTYSNLK